jgi:glyoxylase-like metal-dependent hydrolase (beta-lactamase superfamily II)
MSPYIASFFHPDSHTFSYVVHDPATRQAAVIDPVLDYDPDTDALGAGPLQPLLAHVRQHALDVRWLLETHAHADHVSAGRWLKAQWPHAMLAMGRGIVEVQKTFAPRYALDVPTDGSQFDRLFADGERFALGTLDAEVIAVPGHTSDSVAYRIGDAVFTGDSLFMPDGGTARCDFPGGDPALLYRSIHRLLALPDATRVFICHDYGPGGREVANETTIGEQRARNIHLHEGVSEAEFVATRQARDATLAEPTLMHASVKANLQGGPEP